VVDNVLPYRSLGDPYETFFNTALNIIGPVAFQTNSTIQSQKIVRKLAQAAAFSDNRNLDRHDMFDGPPHVPIK
jgi:hypothetical protein